MSERETYEIEYTLAGEHHVDVIDDLDVPIIEVVHELAHFKESEHNKAFYKLCEYMQPGYHQLEFDLRIYLTWRDMQG